MKTREIQRSREANHGQQERNSNRQHADTSFTTTNSSPYSVSMLPPAHPTTRRMRQDAVLRMQQSRGNQYVQRMLAQSRPARPIAIQRCGDTPCSCSPQQRAQHASDEMGDAIESVQRMAGEHFSAQLQSRRGTGKRLDSTTRAKLEPAMGMDLGSVSIHTDAQADVLARSVDAEAFTTGSDIYFRAGRYNPASSVGLHLLTHEITHTAQQSQGAVSGTQLFSGISVSDPSDSFEQEAEQNAHRVMSHLNESSAAEATAPGESMSPMGGRHSPGRGNIQRHLSAGSGPVMIQRSIFVDQRQPGWKVTFAPKARLTPQGEASQANTFDDGDPNHASFDQVPRKGGTISLIVSMDWKRTSGGTPTAGGADPNAQSDTPVGAKVMGFECDDLDKLRKAGIKIPPAVDQACKLAGNDCEKNIDLADDAALTALCTGLLGLGLIPGGICFLAKSLGITKPLKNLLKKELCKKNPGPTPPNPTPNTTDTGTGEARLEQSYTIGADGKMQFFGPGPISQSSGTAAQVVSPVQFSQNATPQGGEVSLAPMIHSSISTTRPDGSSVPEVHDFQQLFDVKINLQDPPAPQPVNCHEEVGPFIIASDRFEHEDQSIQHIHDWFETLDNQTQKAIKDGKVRLEVTGHASTTGNQDFNLKLADKRAKRVGQVLQNFAGSDAHLRIFSFGKLEAKQKGEVAAERRADMDAVGDLEPASAAQLKVPGQPCTGGTPFVGPGTTKEQTQGGSASVNGSTMEKSANDVQIPQTEVVPVGSTDGVGPQPGDSHMLEEETAPGSGLSATGAGVEEEIAPEENPAPALVTEHQEEEEKALA